MPNTNDNFFKMVCQVVEKIPKGRFTTYGMIATYLGAPRSARMVGWALNKTKHIDSFPAHRVVNKQGLLTGHNHFGQNNPMEERLMAEDIPVKNLKIQNFEKYIWDPLVELG